MSEIVTPMPSEEGYAQIHELEDDGEQQREVYARFGLAVYSAQVLETGIANLISFTELIAGRPTTVEDFDVRIKRLWTRTLGALLKEVESGSMLGRGELDLCQQALAERNRITHRFWRESIENTVTPWGRQRLLDQVDAARRLFIRANDASDEMFFRVAAARGITKELALSMVREMQADVIDKDDREHRPAWTTPLRFGAGGRPPMRMWGPEPAV
ncbi:hypothetical protein ACWEP4_35185 [Streptomyces sp. NPDC004227]